MNTTNALLTKLINPPDTEIPGKGERSQGLNRYMYTEGNPVKYNDPTGHGNCDAPWTSYGCALSTMPGYNFAGPTRKSDYGKNEANSYLDQAAEAHDYAYDKKADNNNLIAFGQSLNDSLEKLNADFTLLGKAAPTTFGAILMYSIGPSLLGGALIARSLVNNTKIWHDKLMKNGWGKVGSWVGGIVMGAFYTALDAVVGIGVMVIGIVGAISNILNGFAKDPVKTTIGIMTSAAKFVKSFFDW